MRILDGRTQALFMQALDGSSLRQQAIANNIANVNTPGYKRQVVSFEQELAQAVQRKTPLVATNPTHLGQGGMVQPRVTQVNQTTMRNDGNNVDIEFEVSASTQNQLYYNTLSQLLSTRLRLLRSVISEGRR